MAGSGAVSDTTLRPSDELLAELIELIETARTLPLSTSCVLPRERLLDLLDELREALPPELDESRRVLDARDRLLQAAFAEASEARKNATQDADTIVADAQHNAQQLGRLADERAAAVLAGARAEHDRLVSASVVHQAAAAASAQLQAEAAAYDEDLRARADAYDQVVRERAEEYEREVRSAADHYAREARAEAERYATKLSADAEGYAERTLDELGATLRRAAATADQGRLALAERHALTQGDARPGSFTDAWDAPSAGTALTA
jgi:cell division septum initiation protein DivIVA